MAWIRPGTQDCLDSFALNSGLQLNLIQGDHKQQKTMVAVDWMIMQCFPIMVWHICQIFAVVVRLGWLRFFPTDLRLIDSVCLTVLNIDSHVGKLVECN